MRGILLLKVCRFKLIYTLIFDLYSFLLIIFGIFLLFAETLIATRTVGIQVEQRNILGKSKYVKYVPIENIKAVIINEIIRRV